MKHKLLIILGVFFVSFAAIFVKLIKVEPSVIAMYRLSIAGLILLPFAGKNKDFAKISKKEILLIFLSGLMISLHYLSWFTSLLFTSVTSSTLIICTEPLVALLFGYLLYREKITLKQFVILLFALFGVAIVAYGDIYLSKEAIIGDLLTFIAVIFFVCYLFIGQKIVKKYSFIIYSSLLFIFAGLILLIYNIVRGYNLIHFTSSVWVILILMALIPNIGQIIFNYELKYVKSSLIATAILLEPVFATIFAVIILNDNVYLSHIIGGIFIIVSVYIYIKLDKIESD